MLPVINLDDENFKDIFDEARKMISGLYPVWTDYNEHDPGITFLELFSWMKEMQQFHLNQIGNDNYNMYLKLLGMKQLKKQPAKVLVSVTGVSPGMVQPKGSKLYAGNICFETIESEILEEARIIRCISRSSTNEIKVEENILNSGNPMRMFLFGEKPEPANEFLIQFDKPLEEGKKHSINFKLQEEYPVKRNSILTEHFYPLAKLSTEYFGESGWQPCEILQDETFQFIQSGKLYLKPASKLQKLDGCYTIRIKLEECNYEVPPVLQEIAFNVLKTTQTDTSVTYEDYIIEKKEDNTYQLILDSYLAQHGIQEIYLLEEKGYHPLYEYQLEREMDRVIIHFEDLFRGREQDSLMVRIVLTRSDFARRILYEGTGFPYQTIDLEDNDILLESLQLFVENELAPGYYEEWEKVDNFSCSLEADSHYVFDDTKGILYFGDCENGKAPEGRILIIGYANSLGIEGNVKAEQINRIEGQNNILSVTNKDNAKDGCAKETIEACFKRFIKEFRQVNRAITDEDYEKIVKSTPGLMIENVKTISVSHMKKRDGSIDENCVSIVIQPFSAGKKSGLNSAYIDNIHQLLNQKRLVGTEINLLSPEYIGISVYIEVVIKPHYINAFDMIKTAVEDYFKASGREFGKPVLYSELYGSIDVLDCISKVQNITINYQGKGITRNLNGDILIPVNGLIYLKEAQYGVVSE